MKIPLNIPYFGEEEAKAAADVVRSTWVAGDGPKCREFEAEFAKYFKVKHVFIVTSGTAALDLAVKAAGIKGEIIVPNYTFTATALAATLNNCRPVLTDVQIDTINIDPKLIKINNNTKAIIPVDYAGHPCDADEINGIAKENNLVTIQDSAQSIGSEYKDRKIGSLMDMTCFSFHPTKNITCGEGGAVTTNNDEYADKIRIIREKGTDKHKYIGTGKKGYQEAISIGNSYVQSDILAAVVLEQLKKLDKINEMRRKNSEYLNKNLKGLVEIPKIRSYVKTNWSLYCVRVPKEKRDFFINSLNEKGVGANVHYSPLHLNKYYRELLNHNPEEFPVSNKIFETLVRLPMYPQLTKEELDYIIETIKSVKI